MFIVPPRRRPGHVREAAGSFWPDIGRGRPIALIAIILSFPNEKDPPYYNIDNNNVLTMRVVSPLESENGKQKLVLSQCTRKMSVH